MDWEGCADGATYDHERDHERLAAQRARVWAYMRAHGGWRTLAAIATATGDPEASVSARLRDFRKTKFGSYRVDHRHVGNGLWQYRITGEVMDADASTG